MIGWIRELADELMPIPDPRPSVDEEQEYRHARHKALEQAHWELVREGFESPSPAQIWERAGY